MTMSAVAVQNYLLPKVSIVEVLTSDGYLHQYTVQTCVLMPVGSEPMVLINTGEAMIFHPDPPAPENRKITRIWRRPGDEPEVIIPILTLDFSPKQADAAPAPETTP